MAKAITDYYCDDLDTRNLDLADNDELAHTIAHNFAKAHRFEVNIAALDDVTPHQWRNQVNRAANNLHQRIMEVIEEHNDLLHMGEFSGPPKR